MISMAYRNYLEIPYIFLPRATVDANFVPWLWASVNSTERTAIISAFGPLVRGTAAIECSAALRLLIRTVGRL